MKNEINYEAKQLVQSQSVTNPYITIFESDSDVAVFFAVVLIGTDPKVVDQIVLSNYEQSDDVIIHWNESGSRSALIIDERIVAVFDFDQETSFYPDVTPDLDTKWSRQTLEFSNDLAVEFGVDQFFKQALLDKAISNIKEDDSQITRLNLYKELLKSKLFVPITTDSPDDPNTLIYTFPNNIVDGVTNTGNLICAYTNPETFNDQVGQHGLKYQKIAADFLCYQAQKFDDILGLTITASNLDTVLLTNDEYKLLSLISEPQRLDADTLLTQLGETFFEDVFDESRALVQLFYNQGLTQNPLIRSAYYCKPRIGNVAESLLCFVVQSTAGSKDLTELIQACKSSESLGCACHIFSLSDVIAQSLEKSMTPLTVTESIPS